MYLCGDMVGMIAGSEENNSKVVRETVRKIVEQLKTISPNIIGKTKCQKK